VAANCDIERNLQPFRRAQQKDESTKLLETARWREPHQVNTSPARQGKGWDDRSQKLLANNGTRIAALEGPDNG